MLLPTDYLALGLCVVASALLALGVFNQRRWVRSMSYVLAGAIFALHVFHVRLEYLWVLMIPHPAVIIVKMLLGWGAAIAILLGLSRHVKLPRDRKSLYFIAGLVAFLCGWIFIQQLNTRDVKPQSQWLDDTLIQSTNNTCMAAATCTYLNTLGVELTELDAVKRGLISKYGGSEPQAWRVLKLSLPADTYAVHIARLSREEMQRQGRWYIGAIQYNWILGHGLAFRVEPDGESVVIRDPAAGQYRTSWDEFSRQWWGVGVWAEPRALPVAGAH